MHSQINQMVQHTKREQALLWRQKISFWLVMLRCIFSGHDGSAESAGRMNEIVEARLTVIHDQELK